MPEPISILLVDDHEDTNRSLMLLLRRRGYEVKSALDMAGAVKLANAQRFDVLISDMSLPDGNGLDLMQRLSGRLPKYGGIIVSGYGLEEDMARSLEAGYKAHLSKPIDMARLDALIRQLVN